MYKANIYKWSIIIIASLSGASLLLLLHEAVPWIRWLIVIAWYVLAAMSILFALTLPSTYPKKVIKLLVKADKTLIAMMVISTLFSLLKIPTLVTHDTTLERWIVSAIWVCFMFIWAVWLFKITNTKPIKS